MFDFFLLLAIAAAAQVAGAVICWFFIRKICSMRTILLAEILLMLAISFLLLEEGLKITPFVLVSTLAGAVIFCIFNRVIPHKHETKAKRIGFLVFIAMCFHEFPEGVAFGASYLIDPQLGIITAVLIALHNIPEGSIVSIPYFMNKRFVFGIKAVLITQLLYVAGGLTVYCLSINISGQILALTMTFAAGAMLYVIYEEFFWIRKASFKTSQPLINA